MKIMIRDKVYYDETIRGILPSVSARLKEICLKATHKKCGKAQKSLNNNQKKLKGCTVETVLAEEQRKGPEMVFLEKYREAQACSKEQFSFRKFCDLYPRAAEKIREIQQQDENEEYKARKIHLCKGRYAFLYYVKYEGMTIAGFVNTLEQENSSEEYCR